MFQKPLSRYTSDKNKNPTPITTSLGSVCFKSLLSRHTFSDNNKTTHPHVVHGGGILIFIREGVPTK